MQVSNSTAYTTLAAHAPLPYDDSAPEGVPDALWRPLSDSERALVRHLGAQSPQAAPAGGADELHLALAPGLRAARSRDDVMLQAQVQDAGGDWHAVTSAEARDGLLHVSDLDALRVAHGRSLPAAIVQSPEALPARAPQAGALGPQALAQIEVTQRGHAYRESQVVRWSHYDNPIDRSAGRTAGHSRIWGDAPPAAQAAAITALVRASHAANLDNHQTALVLAIARTESGFNPDAAAGTTSASGLGQFVDRTGTAYGLGNTNRWNVDAQATALVHHFLDNQRLAQSRHQGDEYIYKYHHDGPTSDYGGLAISTREVMPHAAAYEALLNQGH